MKSRITRLDAAGFSHAEQSGFNFVGDYNYLVMPEDVYETVKKEISHYVGVYVPDETTDLKCLKKAKRYNRTRPVSELLLMMFQSAVRERRKCLS